MLRELEETEAGQGKCFDFESEQDWNRLVGFKQNRGVA